MKQLTPVNWAVHSASGATFDEWRNHPIHSDTLGPGLKHPHNIRCALRAEQAVDLICILSRSSTSRDNCIKFKFEFGGQTFTFDAIEAVQLERETLRTGARNLGRAAVDLRSRKTQMRAAAVERQTVIRTFRLPVRMIDVHRHRISRLSDEKKKKISVKIKSTKSHRGDLHTEIKLKKNWNKNISFLKKEMIAFRLKKNNKKAE